MLLLLNAHDGVDCLKSLLSGQLTEHQSERCFGQEYMGTSTWKGYLATRELETLHNIQVLPV